MRKGGWAHLFKYIYITCENSKPFMQMATFHTKTQKHINKIDFNAKTIPKKKKKKKKKKNNIKPNLNILQ